MAHTFLPAEVTGLCAKITKTFLLTILCWGYRLKWRQNGHLEVSTKLLQQNTGIFLYVLAWTSNTLQQSASEHWGVSTAAGWSKLAVACQGMKHMLSCFPYRKYDLESIIRTLWFVFWRLIAANLARACRYACELDQLLWNLKKIKEAIWLPF